MPYDELVKRLKDRAERLDYDGWVDTAIVLEQAADAIEELSKLVDAIPHVCECCVGCELEKKNGGCDNAFVLSPKRAMQYLIKPRWIPVTERLPEKQDKYLCVLKSHNREQSRYQNILIWCDGYFYEDGVGTMRVTHWMPLPEPPKEDNK